MTEAPAVLTIDLLGVSYAFVTEDEALDYLESWIEAPGGRTRFVAATGYHGLWTAQKEPTFREVLNEADMLCSDGIAPVWLSRFSSQRLPERVPGPDLMEGLLRRANRGGYRSFFLGDTEETLRRLRATAEERFPGHEVAGTFSPPFREMRPEERGEMIERVNASEADVLWVALGTPKQERWIVRHRDALEVPVAVGVGAAFRFLTGQTARAPDWVGRAGLEWMWRLGAEPKKLWRRSLVEGPRFVAYALRQVLREKLSQSATSEAETGEQS